MDDLCFFYLAKMVVVFILMLSLATLKAQRNENDKFFDLMTAIGEDFGGEFNDTEKVLKLDLNGANSFLERLHRFATLAIYKEKYNAEKSEESKEKAFELSRENYKILEQLNGKMQKN
uniref:DUF4760 domain-containing protein n=1 Tax=Globodera pallida TaxID=36090 RepID=A0A183C8H0_GLOPA